MDLEQQIQSLIDNAPQDGVTPQVVEAIAPLLKLLANQLHHLEYHILQTVDGNWVVTTLSNRAQPDIEKNVIYAFPTLKDATDFQSAWDSQISAVPLPVTHILFQMLAIENVNSTVFFDTPGNLGSGIEVSRNDLQNLVQKQLEQIRPVTRSYPSNLPPDLA
jgi:hypothetical protein